MHEAHLSDAKNQRSALGLHSASTPRISPPLCHDYQPEAWPGAITTTPAKSDDFRWGLIVGALFASVVWALIVGAGAYLG